MKKLLSLLAILFCFTSAKSQNNITITDSSFVAWLQMNIPSAMNGNQMDTTSTQIMSLKKISIKNQIVRNLDGIQYFDSLITLDCSNIWVTATPNTLDSLPQLPSMLDTLICSNINLQKIPQLPGNMRYLDCTYNQLVSLPILPNTLTDIDCSNNIINFIPNLSDSLINFTCNNNQLQSLPLIGLKLAHLSCIQNQLQSLPVLPPSLVTLNCSINNLTTLPVLGILITTINCDANQIQILPALPGSLIDLNCSSNLLTSLPTLPNLLANLNCSSNPFAGLPVLPASLVTLICTNDQLTSLPALPNSLTFLNCSNNQLINLPTQPNSLTHLICTNNQLSTLPTLSIVLYKLDCGFNPLPSLPALPNSLVYLICNNNLLPGLPALPASLTHLNCSYNSLPALPVLPNSLSELICNNNQLTVLPALPALLLALNCSNNTLTTIPTLPNNLSNLKCGANSIAVLPVLPSSLSDLNCSYNQIINLPTLPTSLNSLDCSNNNIHCFEPFNSIPAYFNIYNNPFTCIPNYISSMDSILLGFPLCKAGNPFGCPTSYGIVGYTYKDNNTNCLKDSSDLGLKNIPLKLYSSSSNLLGSTYTAVNGVYQFLDSANVYSVVVDTIGKPYIATCQYPGLDSTVNVNVLDTNINFALGCKPGYDVGIQAMATCGIVFPGQIHTLRINAGDISQWYKLNCAAGQSGVLTVRIYGPVSYMGPSPGAKTPNIAGNTLIYTISDFAFVNNTSDFRIDLRTNTSAQAGDTVRIIASITPVTGDNFNSNNNYTFCYNVVNSHDPNIKEVYPINVMPNFSDWLTYTIHFQNTGNAPAFNIRLADTLDAELDLSTFEVIDYSHSNSVSLNGNVLSVYYENIQLPDSSSNPEGSIGYIQYRLKPKATWGLGYRIKNTAYIYFDYNAPIITNTTLNSILDIVTDINELTTSNTVLYPNPTNGTFTIELNTKEKQSVQLFDITGNIVLSQTIENGKGTIDAGHLAAGIYTISMRGSVGVTNKKLVIVK